MTSHFESRLTRLDSRRPRSRDVILRKAVAAERRIERLPAEHQQQAWHKFYLDYTSDELQAIVDSAA